MRVADKPGWSGMAGEIGSGFVVAVSHRNLPTRLARPDSFEREHVAVAEVGPPPDFEIEIWEQQRLRARDAQNMDVVELAQEVVMVDRLGNDRIVIAWQDCDRKLAVGEECGGLLDEGRRQTMRLEDIASKQDNVGLVLVTGSQDCGQHVQAVAGARTVGDVVNMQIRAVHGHDIAVWLRGGSRRHTGLGPAN